MQISHDQGKHSKDALQSLRGQTVHSVPCKRILQQDQIRFVAESATLLFFFDLLCCFGFHNKYLKHCTVQIRSETYICGSHLELRNPEQLAIFACCGIRNKLNVPTKFTLQVYVLGIHVNFVSGIHLHFGTCLNTCL